MEPEFFPSIQEQALEQGRAGKEQGCFFGKSIKALERETYHDAALFSFLVASTLYPILLLPAGFTVLLHSASLHHILAMSGVFRPAVLDGHSHGMDQCSEMQATKTLAVRFKGRTYI
jgi:hypothetical protein